MTIFTRLTLGITVLGGSFACEPPPPVEEPPRASVQISDVRQIDTESGGSLILFPLAGRGVSRCEVQLHRIQGGDLTTVSSHAISPNGPDGVLRHEALLLVQHGSAFGVDGEFAVELAISGPEGAATVISATSEPCRIRDTPQHGRWHVADGEVSQRVATILLAWEFADETDGVRSGVALDDVLESSRQRTNSTWVVLTLQWKGR